MTVLRDIERTIGDGMRFLCAPRYWPGGVGNMEALKEETALAEKEKRGVRLQPLCQTTDQARRLLRVELDHEAEAAIWNDPDCPWRWEPFYMEGARRLRGVDAYVVNKLPAPGWRVINPMVEK